MVDDYSDKGRYILFQDLDNYDIDDLPYDALVLHRDGEMTLSSSLSFYLPQ